MSCSENIQSIMKRRSVNGTVLIVTIWIVLALAGLVLVFARSIRVEAIASANYVASVQSEATAYGAVQFIIAQLSGDEDTVTLESDNPYEQMQVGEGYFWLLRSNLADDKSYDFGITDESSKINLNLALPDILEMLLKLPGMTAELAAAIIDWRDEDSEISPGGAESEYYLLLDDPYYCKNAPLETVEEVLLLRGASPEILYGEDMNRNGVLNYNENDAAESEPADNRDGRLDRGFYDYVTVYSAEENVSQSGEKRIYINEPGSSELSDLIRQVVTDDRYYQIMDNIRSVGRFENILQFYFVSELTYDEFEQIADRITTTDEQYITGRVNVNLAPRDVLLCLPGLSESDVDALIAKRTSADVNLESIAWVVEVLDEREKAVDVGNYITTAQSTRFSGDIVSTSGNGRAFRRYRVVLDMQSEPPSIIYWKELTYLGWPLESEIISTLRSGL